MPVTAANTNADGTVSVEVEVQLPNSKFIPFSSMNVEHIASHIVESVKGVSTHTLTVRAPTTDYVDNVLRFAQSAGTPSIRYRLGVGLPGQKTFLPWQNYFLTNFGATIEGVGDAAGHFITMTLKDSLFTISRSTKVDSHRGVLSDIIDRIASNNSMTENVIEPTVGDGLWIQNFMDDESFIRNRLIRRAVNAKGRGNYNFYIQDNAIHFHTPDYQAQLKELVYYQTNNVGLTQMDETQNLIAYGASNVRMIVFDPYTASASEIAADPEKALRLGNAITPLENVPGSDLNYPFHISTNTVQEAQNMAQSMYENARMQTMGLKLTIARSIFLRVGDLVQVTISPTPGKNSVWAGIYFVTDASYTVESGSLVAVFVVKRGEYQTSGLAPTQINILGDNLILNQQQAPGQPVNLKLAENSVLTHGAGKSSYTSVFVDTQDPNAAPNPSPMT